MSDDQITAIVRSVIFHDVDCLLMIVLDVDGSTQRKFLFIHSSKTIPAIFKDDVKIIDLEKGEE